jgi:hypothetical protein
MIRDIERQIRPAHPQLGAAGGRRHAKVDIIDGTYTVAPRGRFAFSSSAAFTYIAETVIIIEADVVLAAPRDLTGLPTAFDSSAASAT